MANRKIKTVIAALSLFSVTCTFANASNPFFYDKERGWLWREEPVIEEEKEEELQQGQQSSPSQQTEMVELDVAWLKANIENLMVNAINEPTPENLATYAYAQRLMLDMSSRFSSKMTDFMRLEESLDETNRRPMSQFAINSFKGEQRMSIRDVFEQVNRHSGLWFFFSSTCPYCAQQVPVLNQFKLQYGMDILAISMDGGVLPGMEDMDVVVDVDMAMSERFGVSATPSIFVMDSRTMDATSVGEGLVALPELEEKIMIVARERGFITEDEYMLTRGVREINVFRNDDGQILAEKEKLDNDPGYLADLLREMMKDVKPFGAKKVK